jgi:5,10-methylenetetrahydromethanopterin reductase
MVESLSFSGTTRQLRAKLAERAEQGVTELVYQPAGPDVRGELERFMDMARAA